MLEELWLHNVKFFSNFFKKICWCVFFFIFVKMYSLERYSRLIKIWALVALFWALLCGGASGAWAQSAGGSGEAARLKAGADKATSAKFSRVSAESRIALAKQRAASRGTARVAAANAASQVQTAQYISVWISLRNEGDMPEVLQRAKEIGFKPQTVLKTIATGKIRIDSLDALYQIEKIAQVQASKKLEQKLDSVRTATRLDVVYNGAIQQEDIAGFRGEGVLVAVVDVGFDFTHPNFYDIDSRDKSRIKAVWIQHDTSGNLPDGFDYGSEYTTQESILAKKSCGASQHHGTHVAGIASGSGAGTPYIGMAPKSDLLLVSTTLQDADVLDGLYYVYNKAKEMEMPCVVNLSLGSHVGPHDGTSVFDRAIDEMKEPGFVVVGAAGNDANAGIYLDCKLQADQQYEYTRVVPSSLESGECIVDMWSDDSSDFGVKLHIVDEKGEILYTSEEFTTKILDSVIEDSAYVELEYEIAADTSNIKWLFAAEHNEFNGKKRILLYVLEGNLQKKYQITLGICSHAKNEAQFRLWASSARFALPFVEKFPSFMPIGRTDHSVGECGGTSNSVITVGSYVSKNVYKNIKSEIQDLSNTSRLGDIAFSSSRGPTADGRTKPDIAAPGAFVVSSYNSYVPYSERACVAKTSWQGREYPFYATSGTSMATPVVTGIVALLLQQKPDWQADSIKKYLAQTARKDLYTGFVQESNNTWGYGKIDAAALLAIASDSVLSRETELFVSEPEAKNIRIYPNPCGDILYYVLGAEPSTAAASGVANTILRVYDILGRLVKEIDAAGTTTAAGSINLFSLQSGIYTLSIQTRNQTIVNNIKFIKR